MMALKRLISFLLVFVMLFGAFPLNALATEEEADSTVVTEVGRVEQPEETEPPETTIPETTVPETTIAETTVPETTVPETTVPETTPEPTYVIQEATESTEATEAPETPTEGADEIPVTRAQWLQKLVKTFSMTVEGGTYPDNYFQDLSAESEYYYDMLLAVEFGVVDIPAGGNLYPDEAATREFAAVTMNFCLGFQPDPEITLTFSEAAEVANPYDLQIAIDRGWFALVDGSFLPEQPMTQAEADIMVADAAAVLTESVIDENFDSLYTYTAGVVEVPEGTKVETTDEGIVIYNNPVAIAAGDVFVVYFEGIPSIYQAETVNTTGLQTVLTVSTVDDSLYYESVEAQGAVAAKFTDFVPEEDTEVVYIDEDTGEEYLDPQVAEQAMARRVANMVSTNVSDTITLNRTIKVKTSLGKYGISGFVEAELKNPKIQYDVSLSKKKVVVKVISDVDINYGVEADLAEALELDEIYIGFIPLPIGKIDVYIALEAKAAIYGSTSGKLTKGLSFSDGDFRMIKEFKKESFSLVAEFSGKVGVLFKAGISNLPADVLEAYLYAEIGAKGKVTIKKIDTSTCTHSAFYIYFECGAKASVKIGFYKKAWEYTANIWDESNSPIRAIHHYDNGVLVPGCTIGGGSDNNNGYYTPTDSPYWGSNWSGGDNSTGYNKAGEPVVTYGYSLDDDGNATITSYTGNATSLTIPQTIDGHPIVAIGSNVFKNRTALRSVIMQDNILTIGSNAFQGCVNLRSLTLSENLTSIGSWAFSGCTSLTTVDIPDTVTNINAAVFANCSNLKAVTLPASLTKMSAHAFYNCDALTSIVIPKSLEDTYDSYINSFAGGYVYGPFYGCDNLRNITFEEGITVIANGLFANCPGIEAIVIPDTVTVIESNAFQNCTNLAQVQLSSTLTKIDDWAFNNCTPLTQIQIPDTVTRIGAASFGNCSSLASVTLSKGLTAICAHAFYNCDALTAIEIPKSLETTYDAYIPSYAGGYVYGPFYGCDNLKNITFEEGITVIANGLFANCPGIEAIVIPDTVTVIESNAFQNCTNLAQVQLSSTLTKIDDWAFNNCTPLTQIQIPDTVTRIGAASFGNCSSLASVTLSKGLTAICAHAFYNCDALTAIEIPKSLETTYDAYIPSYAGGYVYGPFYGCDNLKEITFEEGARCIANGLFANCPGIEAIVIPDTVTVIESNAFQNCTNLAQVQLSQALTQIDGWAFNNCASLTQIEIPDTVTSIGSAVFGNCTALSSVKLSKGLKSITAHAFYNCDALTTVEIPKSLETTNDSYVNSYAGGYVYGPFYGCNGLKTVTFEESTSRIAPGLFANCPGLESIVIPDTVTTIGYQAFQNCDALIEIVIPESVTSISTRVFTDSAALTTVTWPSSLTTIPESTFNGCTALTTVNLPDTLKTINKEAFRNCDALVTFTMPDSVTTMAETVFYDCDALTEIHLSDNLAKLNNSTFYDCDALTSITIPYGVTSIGNSCFYDCDLLATVDMANSVTSMGTNVFYHNDVLKNVKLSRNLASIPSGTFKECAELEEIVIPYFTTKIDANAFNSSPKLKKVVVHGKLATITSSAFSYPTVTKFYGPTGSYAETWCADNGYTFNENTVVATALTEVSTTLTIPKGKTAMLDFDIDPADFGDTISFRSSNTAVATVDETGKITAVAPGTATIRINVGSVSANCKVTVTQAVTKITLSKTTLDLEVPNTFQLTATITPTDASNQVLAWTSSNEAAATVDENGLITAVGNGTSVITATATDGSGISASCTVTVTDPTNIPVESITLENTTLSIEAMDTVLLGVTIAPGDAANKALVWTSSDDSVATVDENGRITGVKKGTATITATAADGYGASASCTVTVTNTAYVVTDPALLESPHNYPLNCTDFWLYAAPGAEKLFVTFDQRTYVEDEFDFLYVFDGQGNLVDGYTGDQLAGVTLEIPGDTVKIQLSSDDVGSDWGFRVESIEAKVHEHNYVDGVCTECGAVQPETPALSIVTQPSDYVGLVGDTATFSVVAEGEGLKYQWYFYDTAASEWKKSSGNTSATMSVEFKAYRVDQEYRCEITDANGNTVTTDVVRIVAKVVPLVITAHPADHVGAVNDNVSMTVEATGNGLTYQWYYSTDGGVTWAKSGSPGFATANLQPILRAYRDGYQFYCLVTDIFGNTAQSNVASMTVKASEVVITKAPVDVNGAKLGELYYFEAEATGDNLEYRWEFSSDGGETWQLSWNQGYNTATLGVRMNANRDGYLYRCKITSGLKTVVYTVPVSLNLQEPSAVIVGQSGNVAIIANKTATFTVDAEGTDLSYLWYRSNDKGATWTQTYLSGYNTDTLSFVGTAARAAMYMCKVTDGSGKAIWSSPVKLQILSAELKILSQPESVTCASGATAIFTVEAQGDGLKYQWYASSDDGATWTASYLGGYNTDTLSFSVTAARAAKLYKCVITDAGGNVVETNYVSVTIG